MIALPEDLYIDWFFEDYDLPEKTILEIMNKCERELDPKKKFNFKLWEKKCREELDKIIMEK